ncbi:MAG: pyrimidine-nucleoside phosphorylase [Syntrophomonadaceae bacterium]|jgi:pyrimidine-nucleoside phosphorylase|nr:pyrimidine-nucleoside phosphorylase [Syntrophomonadaceae bacterium]
MNVQDLIIKKRNGLELNREEIDFLVHGISDGSIPDYQVSAWAMAVYFQGMNERETRDLALAMAYSGDVADLSAVSGITVDKHSTGGVGDKTTMVVIPLVAAAGVPVAKMSGRGLGHTGGTIDKFESIPGFQVELSHRQFVEQVNQVKAAVISQSGNLVPADKRLYAIRDVTGTVESIPLIASSIMSKKLASGSHGIVLDVKVGEGAFMKEQEEAIRLARAMVEIGRGAGRQVVAVITDMNQPLGQTVGNSLEVQEAIDTLRGEGPADLEDLSIILAAHMLVLGGRSSDWDNAVTEVRKVLDSGQALKKFMQMITAQGGMLDFNQPDYELPMAEFEAEVRADKDGYVSGLNALEVGKTAMLLGAGRERLGDNIDYTAGVKMAKKYADYVTAGEVIATVYSNDKARIDAAGSRLLNAYQFSNHRPTPRPLLIETIK